VPANQSPSFKPDPEPMHSHESPVKFAGPRPATPLREFLRTRLGRDLALAVVLKLVALYALWTVFFSHPAVFDGDAVARAVVAPSPVSPTARNEE
jgi:hypothetical protein